MTVLDQLRFVSNLKYKPRKTLADTLLLYYLGLLAVQETNQAILEIGVGVSTGALEELANTTNQSLYAVDFDQERLNTFCSTATKCICKSSLELDKDTGILGYAHIDGEKNYPTTINDIEYAVSHLSRRGIICVNAYGVPAWPTVVHAVNDSMIRHNLSILFVGDAGVWLTRKEDHAFWLEQLAKDVEFNLLAPYLNIHSSTSLHYTPEHYFMNSIYPTGMLNDVEPNQNRQYYTTLNTYRNKFNPTHGGGLTNEIGKYI